MRVSGTWTGDAEAERLVESVWQDERTTRSDLVNGPVFVVVTCGVNAITVVASDYRHLLARLRRPHAAGLATIRPLAVTGVLVCPDGVVLGRRAATVSQGPGRWEPAPAGGVDRPDPTAVVLDELREELGLTVGDVTTVEPLGILEELATGVHDIVFRLCTPRTATEIGRAHRTQGSAEYDEVTVVAVDELAGFLAGHGLLASAAPMLALAGLLDPPEAGSDRRPPVG